MVAKHVGGKILLFSSAPPTMGEAVVKREASRVKGAAAADRETDLLKPASDAYQVGGEGSALNDLNLMKESIRFLPAMYVLPARLCLVMG